LGAPPALAAAHGPVAAAWELTLRVVEGLAGAGPVAVGCSVPAELIPAVVEVVFVPRVFARHSLRVRYPERGYHTAIRCGRRRDGPPAGV
jgi:hypothetical protein